MKRKYAHTGLHAFLDAHGADTATPEQLTELRKVYWAEVKRKWKSEKRKESYTVTLYFSDREISQLNANAKRSKLSRPKYIKEVALKHYAVPDIGAIRSLFIRNYDAFLELCKEGKIPPDIGAVILYRLELLEQAVIAHLQMPDIDAD